MRAIPPPSIPHVASSDLGPIVTDQQSPKYTLLPWTEGVIHGPDHDPVIVPRIVHLATTKTRTNMP